MKGIRKRIIVTEGDLYTLWKEVEQIRKAETKALYRSKFRQLLKEAHLLKLSIIPKPDNNGNTHQ